MCLYSLLSLFFITFDLFLQFGYFYRHSAVYNLMLYPIFILVIEFFISIILNLTYFHVLSLCSKCLSLFFECSNCNYFKVLFWKVQFFFCLFSSFCAIDLMSLVLILTLNQNLLIGFWTYEGRNIGNLDVFFVQRCLHFFVRQVVLQQISFQE